MATHSVALIIHGIDSTRCRFWSILTWKNYAVACSFRLSIH